MRSKRSSQQGLFDQETAPCELHPLLRVKLTLLLQALLTEAAIPGRRSDARPVMGGREDGDDQDHA
jgi:hypothetical protein